MLSQQLTPTLDLLLVAVNLCESKVEAAEVKRRVVIPMSSLTFTVDDGKHRHGPKPDPQK